MAGGDDAARLVGERGIDARGDVRRVGIGGQLLVLGLAEQRLALDVGAQRPPRPASARVAARAPAPAPILPVPERPPTATSCGGGGAMARGEVEIGARCARDRRPLVRRRKLAAAPR